MSASTTRYGSYLLRIWTEDDQTVRIVLIESATGEQYRFSSYLDLIHFIAGDLRQMLQIDNTA